jgi:hypothetical protein
MIFRFKNGSDEAYFVRSLLSPMAWHLQIGKCMRRLGLPITAKAMIGLNFRNNKVFLYLPTEPNQVDTQLFKTNIMYTVHIPHMRGKGEFG